MGAERSFTRGLGKFFAASGGRVLVGIGDDAAVVEIPGKHAVCTCDPTVEGIHFEADTPLARVGRKAINRNLSDLAAMGARPDYALVSVLLPDGMTARRRHSLFQGMRRAAAEAHCRVIGGDVGRSPGPLVVTVTVIGHLEQGLLRRDRAKVGASLYLTGPLGGSRRGHHLRFVPRIREGLWLARQPAVLAAIDISDGLLLDLQTMLEASGCAGASLDGKALPLTRAAHQAAAESSATALEHGLHDGEDYELLFVLAEGAVLPRGGPLPGLARRPIGRICAEPGIFLEQGDGRRRRLKVVGYEHRL